MIIECVPLPKETGDMAPVYFKVKYCKTLGKPIKTLSSAGKLMRVAQVTIGVAPDWLKDTVMF